MTDNPEWKEKEYKILASLFRQRYRRSALIYSRTCNKPATNTMLFGLDNCCSQSCLIFLKSLEWCRTDGSGEPHSLFYCSFYMALSNRSREAFSWNKWRNNVPPRMSFSFWILSLGMIIWENRVRWWWIDVFWGKCWESISFSFVIYSIHDVWRLFLIFLMYNVWCQFQWQMFWHCGFQPAQMGDRLQNEDYSFLYLEAHLLRQEYKSPSGFRDSNLSPERDHACFPSFGI